MKKKKKAIAQVKSELEERIANTSGEVKAQYKFLNKVLGSDSLSQKIEKLGEDYNVLFEPIGKYFYGIINKSKKSRVAALNMHYNINEDMEGRGS